MLILLWKSSFLRENSKATVGVGDIMQLVMENALTEIKKYKRKTDDSTIFWDDTSTPLFFKIPANFDPRPRKDIELRSYQKKALDFFMTGDSIKSGLLVLPCGSGKTLLSCMIAIKSRLVTLFLAPDNVVASQYVAQLRDLGCDPVHDFENTSLNDVLNSDFFVMTYPYLANMHTKNDTVHVLLSNFPFGMIVLDEIHNWYRDRRESQDELHFCFEKLSYFCPVLIGLTATPYRLISNFNKIKNIIGNFCFEVERRELVEEGFVSDVECFNVLINEDSKLGSLKSNAFFSLLKREYEKNRKIIVLIETIHVLEEVSNSIRSMCDPKDVFGYLCGTIPSEERLRVIEAFKNSCLDKNSSSILLISDIGSVGLNSDLADTLLMPYVLNSNKGRAVQQIGRLCRVASKEPKRAYFFYSKCEGALMRSRSSSSSYDFKNVCFKDSSVEQHSLVESFLERVAKKRKR